MTEPITVIHVAPDSLVPAPYNPRTMSDEARARLRRGIQEFGLVDPLIARRSDRMIVGGHQRHAVALELGLTSVPVVFLDELDDNKAAALNVLLNNPNTQGQWDFPKLTEILSSLDATGYDATLTGFDIGELEQFLAAVPMAPLPEGGGEPVYTPKTDTPIYTPKGEHPPLSALYDTARADALLAAIAAVEMDDATRAFLRQAAQRHVVFDYHQIAEFYCHATPEVQRLMEDSALVIIDFNRAIELGYVQLSKALDAVYEESLAAAPEAVQLAREVPDDDEE